MSKKYFLFALIGIILSIFSCKKDKEDEPSLLSAKAEYFINGSKQSPDSLFVDVLTDTNNTVQGYLITLQSNSGSYILFSLPDSTKGTKTLNALNTQYVNAAGEEYITSSGQINITNFEINTEGVIKVSASFYFDAVSAISTNGLKITNGYFADASNIKFTASAKSKGEK